jgi:hypothetical protein
MFQSFNHPNIQKIEENFKETNEFAQITEYFEQGDLASEVRTRKSNDNDYLPED